MCQYLLLQGIHLDKIPVPCFFFTSDRHISCRIIYSYEKVANIEKMSQSIYDKICLLFFTKLAQRSLRLFKNTIKPGLGTQVIVITVFIAKRACLSECLSARQKLSALSKFLSTNEARF